MFTFFKRFLQVCFLLASLYVYNTQIFAKDLQNLSFVTDYLISHPTTANVFLPFMEQSVKDLDGQVSFKYYQTNEIHPDDESYTVFETGKVDFGVIRPARFKDKMPLSTVIDIPNMAPNSVVGSLLSQDLANKFPEIRAEIPENSEVFAAWTSAAYQLHSIEPIKSLADLKGKRIIIWQDSLSHILKEFGATPILSNTADTSKYLREGKADGALSLPLFLYSPCRLQI